MKRAANIATKGGGLAIGKGYKGKQLHFYILKCGIVQLTAVKIKGGEKGFENKGEKIDKSNL